MTVSHPASPDASTMVDLYKTMLRIRRFEERCVELYSSEKIRGFMHLYNGEEAVATGVMSVLGPDDNVVATYREHGHAIARGVSMRSIMAEMFGKVDGCSRGRGGSMHLFDATSHFYGGNAIVGGGLPIAVGLGLADAMRRRTAVTAVFFGEGAAAEGEFHECLNLAALWHLPVLFVCENNLYAMGTALSRSQVGQDLALRASTYQMPSWSVDGMDVVAVRDAAIAAAESIREGGGPHFIECRTYRFRAHSMYDPELYRDRSEVEEWKNRDPLTLCAASMLATGSIDDSALDELEQGVQREIDDSIEFAEQCGIEPVADLARFVYAEDEQ